MDTISIIIIGVLLLLIVDAYLVFYVRRKRKGSFKLVIEKGVIIENTGHVPAEFLYDVQQLCRIFKPESTIINGSGIETNKPKLEFRGNIAAELKAKIEHSLTLALQKPTESKK